MAIIFLIKKLAQSKGQAMEPPNGSDEALETKTHVVSVKKKTCFQCSHGITLSYVYIYIIHPYFCGAKFSKLSCYGIF